MNDSMKRLICGWSAKDHEIDPQRQTSHEISDTFKTTIKKATIEFYLRFAGAVAIIIYGAVGMKYNTGRYVTWALFTALVGVNAAMMLILWHWQTRSKLSILREIKQLQLDMNRLGQEKESAEK